MNRKYNLKLDLQFRCNNSTMKFDEFDNNTSDFFIKISNGGKSFDVEKAIVVLATIKPSGKVASQFVEVKNGLVYADLKPNMKDEIGTYTAQAMLILEDERVVTDSISYEVEEDKIFSLLNDTVETTEEFTLLTDMLSRLSTIEISEEQRMINEAERILSEENRKIEEAKRVEAELIRQHEEADRTKYDATRESNENIRKQNESIRLANETNRIDEEAKRVEEEAKRAEAEQLRKDNYNFMTEDEDRRRSEANSHKEAENLRVQAETNRVNEEAKRRTTEQARVSAENTRVSNENTRKANETTRQTNETQRVEAETQRQNRYNSFIADAEANANNFENYTNSAKVKEEERKSNELDRKSQEDRRVSNEVERISNENTRKANEKAREKNETSRQYVFENKVNEVDKKIVELNTTKDNFVSSISTKVDNKISEIDNVKDNFVSSVNTKVDSKISELDSAKSDMTNTVANKVNEVENRFNALTSKQQQDAEVIDARDGETSLKARLDRDIEKAKQVYVNVEGSHISTDSSSGYLKDIEILGNTIQNASNLANIRSVGDKVEGQELYEIPVLSVGKNLFNGKWERGYALNLEPSSPLYGKTQVGENYSTTQDFIKVSPNETYYFTDTTAQRWVVFYDKEKKTISHDQRWSNCVTPNNTAYIKFYDHNTRVDAFPNYSVSRIDNVYEPYVEDKLTILSPTQPEKVGDVADRIIEKDGVWGVEKNVYTATSDYFFQSSNKQLWYLSKSKSPSWVSKNIWNEISNMVICNYYSEVATYNDVLLTEGIFIDHKGTSPNIIIGTNDININSLPSDLIVKYQLATPQFIPLPHDQQVKLRTFAGKTNISFGCEIEGTIKAQVPKSLGATVNTHTEQINNLNKELDRVKKLEESTVSTVTTESDFTTVEATTRGYFEDVRLEGKTLVNLIKFKDDLWTISSNKLLIHKVAEVPNLQVGKQYTYVVLNAPDTVTQMYLGDGTLNQVCFNWRKFQPVYTFTNTLDVSLISRFIPHFRKNGDMAFTENEISNIQIMLLEGDHTQNPPSYFEGLKSVGQSATTSEQDVDEIVVESANNGFIDCSSIMINGNINSNTGANNNDTSAISSSEFIRVVPNRQYVVSNSLYSNCRFFYYTKDKEYLGCSDTNTSTITTPNRCYFIKVRVIGTDLNSITIIKAVGGIDREYTSDKKRLLYYNEETQAWEKPILREWDSIEKHANGKYYYHQRSGEVVLNGSENWKVVGYDDNNEAIRFYFNSEYATNSLLINDKMSFDTSIRTNNSKNKYLAICSYYKQIRIRIEKEKLSTVNVEGFKQWLQTNNVTIVYQLAQEKVYECTNIDLITYANETNFIVESGVLSPRTTLKVHNNISNVVSLLQKKVSLLESNVTSYMITQNRLMLASRYNADNVTFKVDYPSMMSEREVEIDYDLFKLIQDNIIVGPENYDVDKMLEIMDLYAMIGFITWEMWDYLYEVIDSQINPVIGDLEGAPEI